MRYTMKQGRDAARRGFTLVELVVVVLVLGIIASVAAPKMFGTAGDARDNTTTQSLTVLRDAIELYLAKTGAYPGDAGTETDFKDDLAPYLKGVFPKSHVKGATGDASVSVVSDGNPLAAGGSQDWKYDNTTGELIINDTNFVSR